MIRHPKSTRPDNGASSVILVEAGCLGGDPGNDRLLAGADRGKALVLAVDPDRKAEYVWIGRSFLSAAAAIPVIPVIVADGDRVAGVGKNVRDLVAEGEEDQEDDGGDEAEQDGVFGVIDHGG